MLISTDELELKIAPAVAPVPVPGLIEGVAESDNTVVSVIGKFQCSDPLMPSEFVTPPTIVKPSELIQYHGLVDKFPPVYDALAILLCRKLYVVVESSVNVLGRESKSSAVMVPVAGAPIISRTINPYDA